MLRNSAWKYDLEDSLDFLDDSGEFSDFDGFLESLVDRDWATLNTFCFYGYAVTREDFYTISKQRPSSDRLEYLAERLPLAEQMEWMREIQDNADPTNGIIYRTNMLIFAALLKATPTMDSSAHTFMKNGFRNLYLKAVERLDLKAMDAFFNGAGGLQLKRAFLDAKFSTLVALKEEIRRAERRWDRENRWMRHLQQYTYRDRYKCIIDVVNKMIEHGADPSLRIPRKEANRQNWVFDPKALWEGVSWDIEMPQTVCALEGASLLKFELLLNPLINARVINLNEQEMEYYFFTQILAERKFASAPGKKPCFDFLSKLSYLPFCYQKFFTVDRVERTLFRMDDPIAEVDHFASALISCGTSESMWAVSDRTLSWEAAVPEALYTIVNDKSKDYAEKLADEDWLVRAYVSLEDIYKWGNQARFAILECFQTHDCQGDILALCILDFCNLYSMNQEFRNMLDSPRNHILGSYCFEGELEYHSRRYEPKTCTAPVSRWILERSGLRYTKEQLQCIQRSYDSKNHIGLCKSENLQKIFNSAERNRELLGERVAMIQREMLSERVRIAKIRDPLFIDPPTFDCGCILCQEGLYTFNGWRSIELNF